MSTQREEWNPDQEWWDRVLSEGPPPETDEHEDEVPFEYKRGELRDD